MAIKKGRVWRIRSVPKLRFKTVSPIKLSANFHDAYIDAMTRLVGHSNNGLFGEKLIPKVQRPIPTISASEEIVDCKSVMLM